MPKIHLKHELNFTHSKDGLVKYPPGEHEVDDETANHPFTQAHLADAPPPAPTPGSTAFAVAEAERKRRLAVVQAMSDDELEEALAGRPFAREKPVEPGKFAEHASLAPHPAITDELHHDSAANDADEEHDEDGEDDGEDGEEDEHEDMAKPADEGGNQPQRTKRRRRRRH